MGTAVGVTGGPDPSWSPSELLEQADSRTELSPDWLVPLGSLDPSTLSPDERLTLAVVSQRMVSVADAIALRALAAVPLRTCPRPSDALRDTHPDAASRVCPGGSRCAHHWETDEIAALTGQPRWLANRRRSWAHDLHAPDGAWKELAPLYASGRITAEHLGRFWRATASSGDEATRAAAEHVRAAVESDRLLSCESFGRSARRAALKHTPPAEAREEAAERSREDSGVTFTPLCDGLAELSVTGEAHKLEALRAFLAQHPAVTRPAADDDRTHGQRQVDLLVSLCLHGTGLSARFSANRPGTGATGADAAVADPARPDPARQDPTGPDAAVADPARPDTRAASEPAIGVIITTSIETLLGLSNESGMIGDTPLSATMIRHWAADPAWAARAVTDSNGLVRTISRRQRRPAERLRQAVNTRWQRCTFPGCSRAARRADHDHARDYARGGDTVLENLHPVCPRHHRLKDQPGFGVRLDPDGAAVWTLPSGRVIRVAAVDHRPSPGPHDGAPDELAPVISEPYLGQWRSETDYLAWVDHILLHELRHPAPEPDPRTTADAPATPDEWPDDLSYRQWVGGVIRHDPGDDWIAAA